VGANGFTAGGVRSCAARCLRGGTAAVRGARLRSALG